MRQMNCEPLVFSHQEHYGWDREGRNAKNKMWSNSPDGWSVRKIERMTFSECDLDRIATAGLLAQPPPITPIFTWDGP